MKIVKGIEEIRAAQTVKFPTHDDVRLNFPDYTAGWVAAQYDHKMNKWLYSYHETKEDIFVFYGTEKKLAEIIPEIIDWSKRSEMYVYHSSNYCKPCWSISFSIFE